MDAAEYDLEERLLEFAVLLREAENAQRSTFNAQVVDTKFDLEERLLDFAVRVIRVTESMKRSRASSHVADQLLRSATSPYGQHGEAEAAESRDDFVHKLRVCHKELREARRWLRLVHRVPLVAKPDLLAGIISEADELVRIFAASIRTAESNRDATRQHLSVKRSALSVERSSTRPRVSAP